MTARADLTALIGSRICHDLISPIGAIGNGVELLMMDGGARGPEVALIAESVAHANARIRYFRVAFGAAGQDTRMARNEVASILSDLSQGTRTAVDWVSPSDLARNEVKLGFLSVMCCETAMPFGGRIRVEMNGGRWTVAGTAARLRVDPLLWEVLSNPGAQREVTPAEVHFALLAEEIARQHRDLSVEIDAAGVRIGF